MYARVVLGPTSVGGGEPQRGSIGGGSPSRTGIEPELFPLVTIGPQLVPGAGTGGGTVKTYMKTIAIATSLLTAAGAGCGGDDSSGPLGNVDSLIILQRPKRNDMG